MSLPPGGGEQGVFNDVVEAIGNTPGLVRLSVGIEDFEDLWDDIVNALECI